MNKLRDYEQRHKSDVMTLAKKIHIEKFPEEYDYQYDDSYDAKQRKKGINPMDSDYIEEVNNRRIKNGFTPLNNAGMAASNNTMEYCIEIAKKLILTNEA